MKRDRGSQRKLQNFGHPGHGQGKPSDHGGNPAAHTQPKGASLKPAITSPPSADYECRVLEQRFWDRQIRIAKWLNGITLGSAIVALVGLLALYESILDAQDSTVQANRAWLSPSFMVLNTPLENSNVIGFQLHVEDTGREPATNVVYNFHHFLAPYIYQGAGKEIVGENKTCEGLEPVSGKGFTVYPGSAKFWISDTFEDRQMISDILSRKGSLIIEGCVAFNTFGKKHISSFRFFLRDVPGPSCWASNEGIVTPQGTIACWGFNGMRSGNSTN